MEDTTDQEIATMSAVAKALDPVKDKAEILQRVFRWAADRYGVVDIAGLASSKKSAGNAQGDGRGGLSGDSGDTPTFSEVGELFHAAKPKTEWQKALVVGYWLMKGASQADFSGADVNSHLKDLGYGVTNITDALNKAMRQEPALVIQTAKSGNSKQSRKKYKLTKAGMAMVEAMARGQTPSEE